MNQALHVGQRHHQPWCRIFYQPAMTTECWCDSQIAASAYKLGVAEGMAMGVAQRRFREVADEIERDEDQSRAANARPVNALDRGAVDV